MTNCFNLVRQSGLSERVEWVVYERGKAAARRTRERTRSHDDEWVVIVIADLTAVKMQRKERVLCGYRTVHCKTEVDGQENADSDSWVVRELRDVTKSANGAFVRKSVVYDKKEALNRQTEGMRGL